MSDWEKWNRTALGLPADDAVSRALADMTRISAWEREQDLLQKFCGPQLEMERQIRLAGAYVDLSWRQEALKATLMPEVKAFLDSSSSIWNRPEELSAIQRAVMGPLADLRAAGFLDQALLTGGGARSALKTYEGRYTSVGGLDLSTIMPNTPASGSFAALYGDRAMQSAMAIGSPWLEVENASRSLAAFTELQGIGWAIKELDPFGDQLMQGLRSDLGDWRDRITFPASIYGDLGARSAFYVERGLRGDLTDFPADAFEESLESAELTDEIPPLIDLYGEPIEATEYEDGSAFSRTNRAHLWLMRFETQLRHLIDTQMTQAFGPNWEKRQLPNGLYDQWQQKKRKAEAADRPLRPLIAYADFTDYEAIICRRDNWKIFAVFFREPANIRESLQRLWVPRIETMHSRPLSQDDELLLFVELKRLGKVFKK